MNHLIIAFLLLFPTLVFGQTDTTFWFAAPDVTQATSFQDLDRPILLRIAALSQSAVVTVSQPANSSFIPQTVNVPANGTVTINLTSQLSQIENTPANTILNYGLLISSSNLVTVYYEILSTACNCNPEIFSLKGKNALGTEFFIPSQNFWFNTTSYSPLPYSSFDIVATEDNTTVSITPKNNIVGHNANATYTINLNKGQTYSAKATSQAAGGHLGGSKVTSNKPIAITEKDDLLEHPSYGTCKDLAGDQIVPINIVGKKYIIVRGFLNNNDKAFVVATRNNTNIFLNGNPIPSTTINEGETYSFNITSGSTYLESSEPVYVLHFSGFDCEVGSSLLPPIECTGSNRVSFTRSTNETFGLIILVKAGSQNNFLLNGSNTLVPGSAFSFVSGTNNQWMFARINFNTAQISTGTGNIISNSTDLFHLGLINGGVNTGCRYGYFSNYNAINAEVKPVTLICEGESIVLNASGGTTYDWTPGIYLSDSTIANPTATPTQSTLYNVIVSSGSCKDTLNLNIDLKPNSNIDILNNDTTLCQGENMQLFAVGNTSSFSWTPSIGLSNSSTQNPIATPSSSTKYFLLSSDTNYCNNKDSIIVTVITSTFFSNSISICIGDSILINGIWRKSSGIYEDTLISGTGCDTINQTILNVGTSINLNRSISICNGDSILIGGVWRKLSGIYADTINNTLTCDSIIVTNLSLVNAFTVSEQLSICVGDSILVNGIWRNSPGIYEDTLLSGVGCDSIIRTILNVGTSINLNRAISICNGDSVLIGGIWRKLSGIYTDTINSNLGCDTIIITNLSLVNAFTISEQLSICDGDSILINGIWRNSSGTYIDTLLSGIGCDSIIQTTLDVGTSINLNRAISICNGDSVLIGGIWRKLSGIYTDTISSNLGCDTIIITNLSLVNAFTISEQLSICDGDSILINGIWRNSSGTYIDTLLSNFGCDSVVFKSLEVNSLPFFNTIPDTSIEYGTQLIIVSTSNASLFEWKPSTFISCTDCLSPVSNPNESITYYVSAIDENGCIALDTVRINLINNLGCGRMIVASAFSPNNDGNNDNIGPIKTGNVTLEVFRIFNRWGELVFETNNVNNWWDGFYKGELQNIEVFVYHLIYKCNGNSKEQKGNITLVR